MIKIESPSGDHARKVATRRGGFSAAFLNNNRNKRSVMLDLKDPEQLEQFYGLAKTADVVCKTFGPVWQTVLALVMMRACDQPDRGLWKHCWFGFEGRWRKSRCLILNSALSGLTTIQGGSDQERPRLIRTMPDKLTGIQMSQALTAALLHRERTGEGQHVTLSMLDTCFTLCGPATWVGIRSLVMSLRLKKPKAGLI